MRARGLKPVSSVTKILTLLSRPMRARGLKPAGNKPFEPVPTCRAPCGRVD